MQRLTYILVYPLLWLISILPFRLLYAFSDFTYLLLYRVFGYRKKVVRENLDLVFPEKSDVEKKQIMDEFYRHLCDMIVEAIKSLTISKDEMLKRMTFSNIELLQNLDERGRSVALMCAHYGSWEWIFIMQHYIDSKGYAVYKRLRNKYFDRLVKRIRAKYDSHLITTKETFSTLIRAKNDGKLTICGFVADQSPKPQSALHWQEFMGIKVPVHVGAEVLAKRFDMAVVYFVVERVKRGYYRTTFKTLAENPKEFEDYKITDEFLKLTEEQIRKDPRFYLWTHKRWKHKVH